MTNYRAPFDCDSHPPLEAEDAIIIGKTNLDEFAMGSSTENSALQKTRNPWNFKCCPGGSSGGSAAAVAARLCPLLLGAIPVVLSASLPLFAAIVGFKPTYGRFRAMVSLLMALHSIKLALSPHAADAALADGSDWEDIAKGFDKYLDACTKTIIAT